MEKRFEKIKCVPMVSVTTVHVCLYKEWEDIYISKSILSGGAWEISISWEIVEILDTDPDMGFIDIGANIGVHSLVVAKYGRKVVAVEPDQNNRLRFRKSILLNKLADAITVIDSVVSNQRGFFKMQDFTHGTNRGAFVAQRKHTPTNIKSILMDDLIPYIPFKTAVLKMDIEHHEPYALFRSEKLFKAIDIRAIFMEWTISSEGLNDPFHPVSFYFKHMVEFLILQGFIPYYVNNDSQPLDTTDLSQHLGDIKWVKKSRKTFRKE